MFPRILSRPLARFVIVVVAGAAAPRPGGAQTSNAPVRPLGAVIATASLPRTTVSQLIGLSDGRVLISDSAARLVQLFDASLAHPLVVLDSAAGKENGFTPQSLLMTFRGDSSLFFDYAARAFVVIAPDGTLGRVMAPPSRVGVPFLAVGTRPASSATLGLVFSIATPLYHSTSAPTEPDLIRRFDDSMFVVRMDFDTRKRDTLAKVSQGYRRFDLYKPGSITPYRPQTGPGIYPFYDDAVVTTDGSAVIFHAREYRLDWIGADGKSLPTRRLSYPWHRVTDAERTHLIDSMDAVRHHIYDSAMAKRAADSVRNGGPPLIAVINVKEDGTRTPMMQPTLPPMQPVPFTAADVPDFLAPTGRHAVWADADNHVWICPILASPTPGFAIWDVIDRERGVVDRVMIPADRTVAGFGPGVVYLTARIGTAVTLEKVRIR